MKRRGFLLTLLIPLLPAPQLPWEMSGRVHIFNDAKFYEESFDRWSNLIEGKKALADALIKDYLRLVNQPSITKRIMALSSEPKK